MGKNKRKMDQQELDNTWTVDVTMFMCNQTCFVKDTNLNLLIFMYLAHCPVTQSTILNKIYQIFYLDGKHLPPCILQFAENVQEKDVHNKSISNHLKYKFLCFPVIGI